MSYNRAQKAPWPPVLRDSTTGNQEARLPRSESAGASHTTFSRVVGNGYLSCLESTLFMAFF